MATITNARLLFQDDRDGDTCDLGVSSISITLGSDDAVFV